MRTLAKILVALALVVVVATGGLYVLLTRVDLARFQNLANARIEAATGRILHVDGALRLGAGLHPTLIAENVRFSNRAGSPEAQMAEADRIEAQVELLPLLRGEVHLTRLIVDKPRIVVETDADGRLNWQFAKPSAPPPEPGNPPSATALAQIGEIVLAHGEVVYRPHGGPVQTIVIPSVVLQAGAADAPLRVDGEVLWQREPIRFSIETVPVGTLMADLSQIPVKGRITGLGGTLDVNGRVLGNEVDTQVTLAIPDLRFVKAQFGPAFGGAGPINFSGHVRGGATNAALENVVARVGSSNVTGDVTLTQANGRYKVAGAFQSQRLSLEDFGVQQPPAEAAADQAQQQRAQAPTQPKQRLIPETPIDLAPLKTVDADIAVRIAMLTAPMFEFHDIVAKATLANGTLDLIVDNASLAGGTFKATASVDSSRQVPAYRVKLQGREFPIAFFLPQSFADAIEGLVTTDIELATTGNSPAAMAGNLDGYAGVVMGEGRAHIRGFESLIGGIGTALGTLFTGQEEWSPVNCSAMRFGIKDGIGNGDVLLFDSRYATVAGEGTIDFGREKLDLLITPRPKAAVTLNISAPVRVTGTFVDPSFRVDAVGALRKIIGVAGLFVFPPAAVAGLVELGGDTNPCIGLVQEGNQAAQRPVPTPGVRGNDLPPAPTQVPEPIGRALDTLDRGLRNLFGGER